MYDCKSSIFGYHIELEYQKLETKTNAISPTLVFTFKARISEPGKSITIFNIGAEVSINHKFENLIIGYAKSELLQNLTSNPDYITLYLQLDNYTLSQIEKFRHGGDLSFNFDIYFIAFNYELPNREQVRCSIKKVNISQSYWIGTIIKQLNFKMVSLIELPKLEFVGLEQAFEKIEFAFKDYSSGNISNALTNCRLVLDILSTYIRKQKKFQKKEKDRHGEDRTVPDWKKFFNSDSKGDVVENIFKKVYFFNTVGGAHPGGDVFSLIDNPYFSILQVYSLTYIIISRLKEIKIPESQK